MRLASLEIKGFKSFADKTVINFNDNITGIVGPNGCGKSNVVDAIRWVLGEQKVSSLRSEKMENLIFNGTKKRRASGLAEVSLTFENTKNLLPTEYSTVTISRMYYRNGESEYRLNNVPCRLKDITALFMDTGISSDSYAIIELGMVDEILNDKDNSRRKLFEQAAGVEKYKTRKKETLSKLNAADQDLNRVDDLLFEIETNLKTLESQARRAQRYYKLKDEYRESSIELSKLLLSGQKEAFKKINRQIEEEQDRKLKLETEINSLESFQQKEKAQNLDKEKALANIQKVLNQKISDLQQKENEKNLLREKIRNGRERVDTLINQIQQAENQVTVFTDSVGNLAQKIDSEESILTEVVQKLDVLKEQLAQVREMHGQKKQTVDNSQMNLQDIEKQIFNIEKQLAVLKAKKDNLQWEIKQAELQAKSRAEQVEILKKDQEILSAERSEKENKLNVLLDKEEQLQQDIRSNESFIDKIKAELVAENRLLDAKRNEYQLTKNLIDNLEGYPESIKFLRKEVKYTRNAPLLSDIISCREEYRAAVENFLEPYLNYYVLNTLGEAVQSIEMLSNASKGRGNFFILEEFNDYKAKTTLRSDNAVCALEILDIDPKFRNLAAYLLDQVYIVDEVKDTEVLAKIDDAILLSRNGKFIRSPYALSGGAVGLFEGKKLGRIKNLEKLKKDISKLENKTTEITSKLNEQLKKQEQMKAGGFRRSIEAVRNELNQLQQRLVTVNTKLENEASINTSASGKLADYEGRLGDIQKEEIELFAELEKLSDNREKIAEENNLLQDEYRKASEDLSKLSEVYNQQNIHFHQQQNRVGSFKQEMNFKQRQLDDTKNFLSTNAGEIDKIKASVIQFEQELDQLEQSLQQVYTEKEQYEQDVLRAEEDYYKSRAGINELDEQSRSLLRQKEQIEIILNGLKDKLNDLKMDLAGMRERLMVEFKVDINDLINQDPGGEYQLEELQERVEKVKNRLDTFGEINPMAVEAFNEMKERYDFIIAQKNDLMEAKANLMQTIREIDETAKTQFLDSFGKVREFFQKVFRSLFQEEDTCDLILLDPENPLESKIEILARPKGKRPLTINQLSGGEKTLTATALLFSLYLIKPAPFCVFDEVDAPLDDANIGKFTNIIREFSKDSQFIIVTHNKQTMTTVDIIYGVTMIEEGVSRVVPVDFSSLN